MILTIIFVVLVLVVYLYSTRAFGYWSKRGVKHDKPIFPFGTNIDGYLFRKNITQITVEAYWKYPKEKIVGFFRGMRPELIIRDPELIKRVLITDFQEFNTRGLNRPIKDIEPLLKNLFFAEGDLWRLLRQQQTGAFTSGKLRAMFPLIIELTKRLQTRALDTAASGHSIDARDLMARYTTDVIGACGFGLDADSFNDDESEFRKLGAKILSRPVKDLILNMLKKYFPNIFKIFRVSARYENDVLNLVHQILKQRNYEPSNRKDFIDLMLECRKKGVITAESATKMKADGTPEIVSLELTEELIAAQVFVFFIAGFEPSSSTSSFTLHQLAFHPEVQTRCQQEIDTVLARHDNKLCYDAVREMTYVSWAFKEGMRMFPPVGFLIRQSLKPYTFPEINLTIDKGVGIYIPLQAIHNDPKYFENAEEFRPERFDPSKNNVNKIKHIYLPFGDGPRVCIGSRLGEMQVMTGLVAILSRFTVEPAPESQRHPKINPKGGLVQMVKNGLPLRFRKRNNVTA